MLVRKSMSATTVLPGGRATLGALSRQNSLAKIKKIKCFWQNFKVAQKLRQKIIKATFSFGKIGLAKRVWAKLAIGKCACWQKRFGKSGR